MKSKLGKQISKSKINTIPRIKHQPIWAGHGEYTGTLNQNINTNLKELQINGFEQQYNGNPTSKVGTICMYDTSNEQLFSLWNQNSEIRNHKS